MKIKANLLAALLCVVGVGAGVLTSCIKDALPNIEVDLLSVKSPVNDGIVKTIIQENGAVVYVNPNIISLENVRLDYEMSEGATISPDPSTVTDYSSPRKFVITSEDGAWKKEWTVQVLNAKVAPTKFSFDNWYNPENTSYKIPYEISDQNEQLNIWACTNNSLSILLQWMYGENLNASHYGAHPTDDTAVDDGGKALELLTYDIAWAAPTKPFVSGCMFLGEFDGADTNDLTATHFGLPFNEKPVSFKGYYKYNPGVVTSTGKLDKGLIEAVLFRTDNEVAHLTGETIKDKAFSNIIAYAEIDPDKKTDGYVAFDVPFVYTQDFSNEDMKNWKYSMAVYFCSSIDGDQYLGASGTTLCVDNVEIICEK